MRISSRSQSQEHVTRQKCEMKLQNQKQSGGHCHVVDFLKGQAAPRQGHAFLARMAPSRRQLQMARVGVDLLTVGAGARRSAAAP